MLSLDVMTAADDPTAIVEEYTYPWWEKPQEGSFSVMDGLEQFAGKVSAIPVDIPRPADLL